MVYTTHLLVIANVTAASKDLLDALQERAKRGALEVTLLMPSRGPGLSGRDAAEAQLEAVLRSWREAGIPASGIVGDSDPIVAVQEAWAPGRYDEVLVSTLPGGASKWLRFDFPQRVAKLTDAPVTHVISRPPDWHQPAGRIEPPHAPNPLGPLSVLGWGGRRTG